MESTCAGHQQQMNAPVRRVLVLCAAGCVTLFVAMPGRADVPAGYQGKPFDPAVAGGVGKIPATVKAGPYPIPGRIDFINYDLGGVNVGYFAADHITNNGSESIKLALGYRTDAPTATKISLAAVRSARRAARVGAALRQAATRAVPVPPQARVRATAAALSQRRRKARASLSSWRSPARCSRVRAGARGGLAFKRASAPAPNLEAEFRGWTRCAFLCYKRGSRFSGRDQSAERRFAT